MLKKIKRAFGFGSCDPMEGSTIIINAEKLERRVALLENGVLEEYTIEREGEDNIVGGIFKGDGKRRLGVQAAVAGDALVFDLEMTGHFAVEGLQLEHHVFINQLLLKSRVFTAGFAHQKAQHPEQKTKFHVRGLGGIKNGRRSVTI